MSTVSLLSAIWWMSSSEYEIDMNSLVLAPIFVLTICPYHTKHRNLTFSYINFYVLPLQEVSQATKPVFLSNMCDSIYGFLDLSFWFRFSCLMLCLQLTYGWYLLVFWDSHYWFSQKNAATLPVSSTLQTLTFKGLNYNLLYFLQKKFFSFILTVCYDSHQPSISGRKSLTLRRVLANFRVNIWL